MITFFGVSLLVAVIAGGSYLYYSLDRIGRDLDRYRESDAKEGKNDKG